MKSVACLKMTAPVLIASALTIVLFCAAPAWGDDDVPAKSRDEKVRSMPGNAGWSAEDELKFDGVKFDPDSFIVDELFDVIRYKKFRDNMSGGLTSEGLNFSVTW